jgi:hypothetical protein
VDVLENDPDAVDGESENSAWNENDHNRTSDFNVILGSNVSITNRGHRHNGPVERIEISNEIAFLQELVLH